MESEGIKVQKATAASASQIKGTEPPMQMPKKTTFLPKGTSSFAL